ncbi:MAG: SEL1-like repeat protein [Acidiferrobacterales bacterium]
MNRFSAIVLFVALTLISTGIYADGTHGAMVKLFQAQLALAQTNQPDAQYYLGEMYENGYGTKQNLDEAFAWYKKSAHQGFEEAQQKIQNRKNILQEFKQDQNMASKIVQPVTRSQSPDHSRPIEKKRPAMAQQLAAAQVTSIEQQRSLEQQRQAEKAAKLADFKRRYTAYLKALEHDRQSEAYPME